MPRIGIDIRLTHYRRGGIAEYMRQIVSAMPLHATGEFTWLILHHFRARETLTPGSCFHRANCFTPCHHRWESLALGFELLPRRLDLLHSPDFIPPRVGASRYVITVHDLAFLLYPGLQTEESLRYYSGQIRRAVKQADQIIAVSEATRQDLMRLLHVSPEKITMIWEGVHPAFQVLPPTRVAEILARYHLPAKYLLFVGTIEPRKNLPNLLKAYQLLRDRYSNLPPLVLVGEEGWLSAPSIEAITELGLEKEIIRLGGVPFDVLPALYNGAMAHLYPSIYEGFGFPALEAMACGIPTLVSDRGALREVAGDAALFVDPDDPESIAEGMLTLLEDTQQRDLLRNRGLERVRQFTWESAAMMTLDLYRRVLA